MGADGGFHEPQLPLLGRLLIGHALGSDPRQLIEKPLSEIAPCRLRRGRERAETLVHLEPRRRNRVEHPRQGRLEARHAGIGETFDAAHDPVGKRQLRIDPPLAAPERGREEQMERLVPRDPRRLARARSFAQGETDAPGADADRLAAGSLAGMERHLHPVVRPRRRQQGQGGGEQRGRVGKSLQDGVGHARGQAALSGKQPQQRTIALEGDAEAAAGRVGPQRPRSRAFLSLDAHLKAPCYPSVSF